jgi:hypothetical protein
MARSDVDDRIDELYQLPLDQFTPARNALAKELKRPTIKDLEKPNVAAWAVNQLYWNDHAAYEQVTEASLHLRDEHKKRLAGKPSDIRDAEKTHREAIRAAVDRVRKILAAGGHALSDATVNAVQETLEALPSDDANGRLTRPLKRMGFEALAGFSIGARPKAATARPSTKGHAGTSDGSTPGDRNLKLVKSGTDQKREREQARQREREERERKARREQAQKDLQAAEAAMLRAEDDVKTAEKALGEARAKRDHAVSEYQRARLRARE